MARTVPRIADIFIERDIVITTYGTLRSDIKMLVECHWIT